jgi:DNA primase
MMPTIQRRPPTTRRGRLVRERLPDPAKFFEGEGLRLTGGGEWRSARCPFHQDHAPSLRVCIDGGAFRCMACGAKGGDVIAFYRLRHGVGFIDACRALGAWG